QPLVEAPAADPDADPRAARLLVLADVTFADCAIDGSGVELGEYDPLANGLGLQYVLRRRATRRARRMPAPRLRPTGARA
ncbi:MAG: hypothetical protein QOJ85_2205, partial [Solirubrobacteraceae bacterium]|nr:hypothetical protein [Solirubrobacteraceae bacterium]